MIIIKKSNDSFSPSNEIKENDKRTEQAYNVKADIGIKWTTFSTVYSILLQTVKLMIIARFLTPEQYGIMGLVVVVIFFGQTYSDSGISAALIHYQIIPKIQLSTLYWLNVILGLFIYLIFFLISPFISLFYQESDLTLLIRITAITFIVTPYGQQFQTLLQKEFHFKRLAIINIVTSTFSTTITILLAVFGFGVMSLVAGYVMDFSVRSTLTIFAGWGVWKPGLAFDRKGLKKFLTFGFYQLGDRTLNYFNINIDVLIIGKILGATALGYYNIAYNLILYPVSAINPIFTTCLFRTSPSSRTTESY